MSRGPPTYQHTPPEKWISRIHELSDASQQKRGNFWSEDPGFLPTSREAVIIIG